MELNDQNLNALVGYLQQTLSPESAVRLPAEQFLRSVEVQRGYPILLLTLLSPEREVDPSIKMAASITFKNFIKRNWKVDEDSGDRIHGEDREAVKRNVVDLMLKSPSSIQKQLSTSIAIIGQQDFPQKWPNLLGEMVARFSTGDFNVINGVLQTAFSIFEKYSYEMKSQKLWEEIKFVLENFAQAFTDLFGATVNLAKEHASNRDASKVIFGSLFLISKIFYFLNYQDLPEHFEDNMKIWMNHFHDLLTSYVEVLRTDDDEEPGPVEELKSQICDNIGLYAHKYEEEFREYMPRFVNAVWGLLQSLGPQVKYDMLTSNAVQFLASVADRQQYKSLFEDPATLASICEKIIIPNIQMRDCDVELFEDNAEEYIRRDLEGSDVDTRRRAACDLVKGLSRFFEHEISSIFGSYVGRMLETYAANPEENWKSKDAAIYLVTSLATRARTAKHGITKVTQLVDINEFCNRHIMLELNSPNLNSLPVLKASAIKYVMVFRSQLPPELVKGSLRCIVNHLRANSHVTHTYASAAIEKILIMRSGPTAALVTVADLHPIASQLLNGLFGAFSLPGSAENEYVMKCVMRSFSSLQEAVVPYLATLLPVLTQKLEQAAKNPTKPHYNHYLFESLSLSIRIVCKSRPEAVENFETVLFPVFQEILRQDVQEFVPYVFQILSLLLEVRKNSVPGPYMELFHFLLVPVLWERPGNIRPLVRLIQAYISNAPQQVVATNKFEALLGVFQKLVASRSNDHEGFYLIQAIVEHMPEAVLNNYIRSIFSLLFQRLTSSKTTKFIKSFLVFVFLYVIKFGGSQLQANIDAVQSNLFGMVCERLIVLEVQKVSGPTERKICAVGMTKLLCETPSLLSGNYSIYWNPLLKALVALFELPQDDSIPEDEHFVEIEDTPGYQTAYSQLVFAGKREVDPITNIADPVNNLAQCLHKLSVGHPGMIMPLVGQLPPEVQNHLNSYLLKANVTIA